jgi:quercetin dioxygenase-like cupin family protein
MKTASVFVLALFSAAACAQAVAQVPGVRRTDLLKHDSVVSGREVVEVRVEVDAGHGVPRHTHPGDDTWSRARWSTCPTAKRP